MWSSLTAELLQCIEKSTLMNIVHTMTSQNETPYPQCETLYLQCLSIATCSIKTKQKRALNIKHRFHTRTSKSSMQANTLLACLKRFNKTFEHDCQQKSNFWVKPLLVQQQISKLIPLLVSPSVKKQVGAAWLASSWWRQWRAMPAVRPVSPSGDRWGWRHWDGSPTLTQCLWW